jgi:signal peptidase I
LHKFMNRALVALLSIAAITALVVVMYGMNNYKIYAVRSGSMKPTIPPRSAVIVKKGEYRTGQPITFLKGGSAVTHRFASVNPDGTFTTKGDANKAVDPWQLEKSHVVGGVIAAPRELGYWLLYLKSPLGLVSLVLSVVCIWQAWSLTGIRQESTVQTANTTPPITT